MAHALRAGGDSNAEMSRIAYRAGYRYQLHEAYCVQIPIRPPEPIFHEYITLATDGRLCISSGYCWDGSSGALDTNSAMRGSLLHDAGYQLLRLELLPEDTREAWDALYRDICLEDGMWPIRALLHFDALRLFGQPAADPKNDKPVLYAPG